MHDLTFYYFIEHSSAVETEHLVNKLDHDKIFLVYWTKMKLERIFLIESSDV